MLKRLAMDAVYFAQHLKIQPPAREGRRRSYQGWGAFAVDMTQRAGPCWGRGHWMNSVKVVGLGGSLKEASASLLTLELALGGARDAGAQTELLDVRLLDLPMYVPGME